MRNCAWTEQKKCIATFLVVAAVGIGQTPAEASAGFLAFDAGLGRSAAAQSSGDSVADCFNAVHALLSPNSTSPGKVLPLVLATGKMLPLDAGKYKMCMSAPQTRYFLVTIAARAKLPGPPLPIKVELGFCVPDVCAHQGVNALVASPMAHTLVPGLALLAYDLPDITSASPQLDLHSPDAASAVAICVVIVVTLVVVASSYLAWGEAPTAGATLTPSAPAVGGNTAALRLLDTRCHDAGATPGYSSNGGQLERAQPPGGAVFGVLRRAFQLTGKTGTLTKLLETAPYRPTDSLNGLRVLSMVWIILGHTFLMPAGISGYQNFEDVTSSPMVKNVAEENPFMFLIISAQAGVDTFFFLAGFLMSFVSLKEFRNRTFNKFAAFVLRYLRLTPSLGFAMLVYYQIWAYMGSGPFAVSFQDSIFRRCRGSWWSELTYTMNFIPFDSDAVCMGWTWYLGDDLIFFIVSLFIMPIYVWRKWLGWLSVAGLTLASFGYTFWLIMRYNLGPYVFDEHYQKYSYWAYSKPYSRVPAYLVGLVAAWLVDEFEARGLSSRLQRSTRIVTEASQNSAEASRAVWWSTTLAMSFSFATLAFLVFIPWTDFGQHKNSWSSISSAFYLVVGRCVWAMCLAVLTLLCYYGHLPTLDSIFSHRWWTPLSRLTYGAYLVHPLVIKLAAGRSLQFYEFGAMDIFYRHLGNCVLSYSGAVILWVLVERPIMTLTTAALKKPRSSREQVSRDQRHNDSVPAVEKPDR